MAQLKLTAGPSRANYYHICIRNSLDIAMFMHVGVGACVLSLWQHLHLHPPIHLPPSVEQRRETEWIFSRQQRVTQPKGQRGQLDTHPADNDAFIL